MKIEYIAVFPDNLHLMLLRRKTIFIALFLLLNTFTQAQSKNQFVELTHIIPDITLDIRYYTTNNFLGKRVAGYEAPAAYLTKEAATALAKVATDLRKKGFMLKVFDAYRPQSAVTQFGQWAKDLSDTAMKLQYYPHVPKSHLYGHGYISTKSGHSRGSTVDITIIDPKTKQELDMGSRFDFFGEISQHNTTLITSAQAANRKLLKTTMEKYGFKAYWKEWWHYTLINEPYPNTYFNFPVK